MNKRVSWANAYIRDKLQLSNEADSISLIFVFNNDLMNVLIIAFHKNNIVTY